MSKLFYIPVTITETVDYAVEVSDTGTVDEACEIISEECSTSTNDIEFHLRVVITATSRQHADELRHNADEVLDL